MGSHLAGGAGGRGVVQEVLCPAAASRGATGSDRAGQGWTAQR